MRRTSLLDFSLADVMTLALLAALIVYVLLVWAGVIAVAGLHDYAPPTGGYNPADGQPHPG